MHLAQQTRWPRAWLLLLGLILWAGPARAVVLDWSAVSWTAESLANNLEFDPDNPGHDLTLTVGGDTGQLKKDYPAILGDLTGGNPGSQSLHLRADFANTGEGLTVTINFNYDYWLAAGVQDVTLTLFNIDADSGYIDQIRNISGTAFHGGAAVAATVTGGSSVTVSGSGTAGATATGNAQVADNSGAGNVTVNFGTNILSSLSFTIGNDPALSKKPKVQDFALYQVSYKKNAIPEVGIGWITLATCAGLITFQHLRRHWRSRRASTAPPPVKVGS